MASDNRRAARVLVTDGEERSVLAACRALRAAGYRVTTTQAVRSAPARWSRACQATHRVVDPRADPDGFAGSLVEIVRREPHSVLIPGTDAALLAVSDHREQLESHVRLGLPAHEVVERSLDKLALAEAAERAGIPSPPTAACSTLDQAAGAAERFGYPVLVKPRRTLFRAETGLRQQSSLRVDEPAELAGALRLAGSAWLIQAVIEGAVHSFSGVRTPDGLIAHGLSRYLRTWPSEAGNASFAYTIPTRPTLAARVEAMLADIGWEGIFEVELIGLPGDEFAAIDLNPRVFGSLALVSAAGAPLAPVWCRWLGGEAPAPVVARPGRRYRWEDGELRNALRHLRHGRVRASAGIAAPQRRVAHAFFAARDPLPAVARALWLASLRRRRARAAKDSVAIPAPERVPVQTR